MDKPNTTMIAAGSIELTSIDETKVVTGKNGKKYLPVTLYFQDQSRFGNNCSIQITQTREEKEAKTKRTYIGNLGVRWLNQDAPVILAEKQEVTNSEQNVNREDNDGLFF